MQRDARKDISIHFEQTHEVLGDAYCMDRKLEVMPEIRRFVAESLGTRMYAKSLADQ